MKIAVVYYSLEGNTKYIAESIAKEKNADLIRLVPKKDVNKKSFSKFIWGGKQVFLKQEPELEEYTFDKSLYDVIIIGTPVWAFTYSPAIKTFLAKEDLEGKNIALFCCYGGNAGKTLANFKKVLPKSNIVGEIGLGEPIKDISEQKDKVLNWLNNLNI